MSKLHVDRYVIARDRNVLRVNFRREPDPPAPKFPGAAALHIELSQSGSCEWLGCNPSGPILMAASNR